MNKRQYFVANMILSAAFVHTAVQSETTLSISLLQSLLFVINVINLVTVKPPPIIKQYSARTLFDPQKPFHTITKCLSNSGKIFSV